MGFAGQSTKYIEQAFRSAHEADPEALLFYNDNEGETVNLKSDAIYAMVRDFGARAVPIDGIGLQMHIFDLDLDLAGIAANIARFIALGVQVPITEMDVALPTNPDGTVKDTKIWTDKLTFTDGSGRYVSRIRDARPSQRGDSPTSTRGSVQPRKARSERR
jgi:GH35 family endo-1,4-beta-xylanase